MNDDYIGDKSQDFMEDIKALCRQYGYKLITIKVKENENSEIQIQRPRGVQGQ